MQNRKIKDKAIQSQACTDPKQFQEAEAPRITRQSAYEKDKFVSHTHRSPLPHQEGHLVPISVRG